MMTCLYICFGIVSDSHSKFWMTIVSTDSFKKALKPV